MKKILTLSLVLLFSIMAMGQSIDQAVGHKSTGLTTAQLNALPLSVKTGLTILDTTLGYVVTWNGTEFVAAGSSSTADGSETIVQATSPITISGSGTVGSPYQVGVNGIRGSELADFLGVQPIDLDVTVNENPVPVGYIPIVASNTDFTWTDPDTFDDQTAAEVTIADSGGNYTATNVEDALDEALSKDDDAVEINTSGSRTNYTPGAQNVESELAAIDDALGNSISYAGVFSQGTANATVTYDLSLYRRVDLNHSGTAVTISFSNVGSSIGEPVFLHITSTNASGTTVTFDTGVYDNRENEGFSVVLAQNESINLNFVVYTTSFVRATNYPAGSGGSDNSLSEADQIITTDRNIEVSGTGTALTIGPSTAVNAYIAYETAASANDHSLRFGNPSQGMTFTVNEGWRLTSPMSMFSSSSEPAQHIGRFYHKTGANAGFYYSDGTSYTRLLEEGEGGGSAPDITFNNKTADYTVLSTDFDSSTKTELVFDSATDVTLTIDDVATAGENVAITNHGAGDVLVVEGTGTINAEGVSSFKVAQYSHAALVRYASDYRPRGAWEAYSNLDDADNRASTFASWREEDLVAGITTNWTDRINDYVAVANGGITASAAATGVQFSYDGVDDSHSVDGQSAAFDLDPDVDNFSIAMRFGDNVPSAVIRVIYYADGNGDADAQYAFRRQSSTEMRTYTKGLFDGFTITDTDLTDDVFVLTFDTINVRVYQNGTLIATNAVEGVELATNAILSFAATNGGTAFETAMTLRDVVFYNEVLDQTAVNSVTTALQN